MKTIFRIVSSAAIISLALLPSARADDCTKDGDTLAEIRIETISSPQKSCADFTVIARAYNACGQLLEDYNAPASWGDASGTLTPAYPSDFVHGVSVTPHARVNSAFTGDMIHLESGGVLAWSNPFDVDGCCDYNHAWTTARDYQKVAGKNARAHGVLATSNALYAVGQANDASDVSFWTTQKSIDGGANWTTIDQFSLKPGQPTTAAAIAQAPDQDLYVVGAANDLSGLISTPHLVIRKSTDAGQTWTTMQELSASPSAASAVATDAQGNIYVTGIVIGLNAHFWLVERSQDFGVTWNAVDLINAGAHNAFPLAVVTAPSGGVYVAGQINDGTSDHWIVRHSATGANGTFTQVQDYQLASGHAASAHGGTVDASGNIYFTGSAQDASGKLHWIIQKASDANPAGWQTYEDFFVTGDQWNGGGILVQPSGQVFTTGEESDVTGKAFFETLFQNGPGAPFVQSDSLVALDPTGGFSLTQDSSNSVYAAGFYTNTTDKTEHWLVRKITCQTSTLR